MNRVSISSVATTAMLMALVTSHHAAAQVFDWNFKIGDAIRPGTIPVPTLTAGSGPALESFLASQATPSVKVRAPLASELAANFFDGDTPIANVFSRFDNTGSGGNALTAIQVNNLVSQVAGTASTGAAIGQFALDTYHPDNTDTSPTSGLSDTAYDFTGVNTAMPELNPGSTSFRSTAWGSQPPLGSNAPNTRSALFTLPITRLSRVAQNPNNLDVEHLVPFVSRFNLGHPSPLVNSEFMGAPAWESADQFLSRGDYQAMLTHYRMRGATGVVADEIGIANYSREEFLDDTVAGWHFLDQIYPGDTDPLNMRTLFLEVTGLVWSGVAGQIASGETVATLLLSNMTSDVKSIGDIDGTFDGFAVNPFDLSHRTLDPASHRLLTFWLHDDVWLLLGSGEIFELEGDSNGGIGFVAGFDDGIVAVPNAGAAVVPVPAAAWLMGAPLLAIAARARRRVRETR